MPLDTYLDDPSIPDATKLKGLQSMGYSRLTAQALLRVGSGAKRERLYERFFRDPARQIAGGAFNDILHPIASIPSRHELAAGEAAPISPESQKLAGYVVPEDLAGAGSLAGAVGGAAIGHPFLGAEIGGTIGGIGQGRSVSGSAAAAAPAALANWLLPKAVRSAFASKIAKDMSDRASMKISESTARLFHRLFTDNPMLPLPTSPSEMRDFYGSGQASPAIQTTGKALGDFRNAIKKQPAFQFAPPIAAPVKYIDPVTRTPQYAQVRMSLPDAIDYQQALYGKGYLISGGPRGSIMAEPDRALAAQVRQQILNSMKQIPRSGPYLAKKYEDLTHDYGVAQTVKDVFTKDTVTPEGLLNHEKVYSNLADQKRLSHLNSLVGPQATRGYVADVAPEGQRISQPSAGHVGLHAPGPLPARIGVHIAQAPIGPAAFTPKFPVTAGVIGSQAASQAIENLAGGGNE